MAVLQDGGLQKSLAQLGIAQEVQNLASRETPPIEKFAFLIQGQLLPTFFILMTFSGLLLVLVALSETVISYYNQGKSTYSRENIVNKSLRHCVTFSYGCWHYLAKKCLLSIVRFYPHLYKFTLNRQIKWRFV